MIRRPAACLLAAVLALTLLPGAALAGGDEGDEYIRLPTGVTEDMLTPEYWIGTGIQASRAAKPVMSAQEISRFNRDISAMISVGEEHCALTDIPDSIPGSVVRAIIESHAVPKNAGALYINGSPSNADYWTALASQRALDAIQDTVSVRFGYSVRRAQLRLFPTDDFAGVSENERLYDKLVMSELMPYLPLAVLHESADGEWCYVMLYGFGGWTRKENVSLCPGRADWLDRMEAEDFLVVTGRELRLPQEPYSPQTSALSLPMGTKLPLVKAADAPQTVNRRKSYGCYVVKLPVRGDGGAIADEYALIPVSENVSRGYLPYTRENELRLAFEFLGDRYGWAGMYGANDCSGIIHEIFACFGFCLPRTAEAIMAIQGFGGTELQDKTDAQKLRALAALPAGTLLGFPGHIMLYLGTRGGRAYVISAAGSFASDAAFDGDYSVNGVSVNSLADTRRRSGLTWLESLTGALTCAAEDY